MNLSYTERAKVDVELAFYWYEKQRDGLGFDFLDCIENGVKSILDNPKIYQINYSNFRCCVIRRFPFCIFYTIEKTEIVVHSVFDSRQSPKKAP